MRGLRVISVALVLLTSGFVSGHAGVRAYKHLSQSEQMALLESEQRLALYDYQLLSLDRDRKRGKISAEDYAWTSNQLTELIREESLYQNAILLKKSDLPQRALEVLGTIEHAAILVVVAPPVIALSLMAHASPPAASLMADSQRSGSFNP